ncbi:uncharacterized protein LOC108670790 [Hyalella azteca]|uniref:Uncharacterized protein LOC108670790 n=1 Tax=Hyalella azteca TaxID=294128 RepID=A0A8B7NJF1_HYAAZ|nr:uncharacterized protein LOC108670790 [Hyalella azteca]
MNRGFLLLVVAAASVSAQTVPSSCELALTSVDRSLEKIGRTCNYRMAWDSYNAIENCRWYSGTMSMYNVEVCDPIVFDYMKCILKASGLLKVDGSFDDAAFQKTTLQDKCNSDVKFSTAYKLCKNSTMKYLNYYRFVWCLNGKLQL